MFRSPSDSPAAGGDASSAWLRWYDAWVAGVGLASIAGLGLVTFGRFHGWVMVAILLGVPLAAAWRLRRNLLFARVPAGQAVLLVLTLTLAWWLRTPPYPNQSGGYDPGLYVNMASLIRHSGGLSAEDGLRASLDPAQRALYDTNGGSLYPGVEMVDADHSLVHMPFYPLHPVWMAATGSLAPSLATGSIVLFGLLAVTGLFLLYGEITGRHGHRSAYLVLLVAAIHPGLVLLSKYPVGEMLALAFTTNGFYYMARAFRAGQDKRLAWDAWLLAWLCFNAFFYVRMTGFVYMPVFAGLLLGGLIALPDLRSRLGWVAGIAGLAAWWLLSCVWYHEVMPRLFLPMVTFIQRSSEGVGLVAAVGLVVLLPLAGWMGRRRAVVAARADQWAPWLMLVLPALVLVALYLQAGIMRTSVIPDYPDYPGVTVESDSAFTRGFLYRYAVYLFPPALLLLVLLPWLMRGQGWTLRTVLALFVAWMMALVLFSPYAYSRFYQFYYDRYYLSEVVPYSLVLLVAVTAGPVRSWAIRWLRGLMCAVMVVYFGWFSVAARGKTFSEPKGQRAALEKALGRDALVLMVIPQDDPARSLVGTPLVYSSRLAVFPLGSVDDAWRPEIITLTKRFPRTALVTSSPVRLVDMPPGVPELTLTDRFVYTYHFFTPLALPEALARQPARGLYRWIDLPWRVHPHSVRLFIYDVH